MFLRYNLSYLARAAALAGFVDEARRALQPPGDAPRLPLFEADWDLAEAAVLVAEHRIGAAFEQALAAAHTAANRGQWTVAAFAAHDAARYSGSRSGAAEAAALLVTATDQADSPLLRCFRDHTHARARRDPELLAQVSEQFERLGAMLYAAEAAYACARAHRDCGDSRAAAAASIRATMLHSRCEHALIPWIAGNSASSPLTAREQQVALLAAAGQSDSEIATELGVSPRTVQTHLTRIYSKLNIAGRRELPDALT